MELFESGKILWHRRHLVLVALLISVISGLLLTFHIGLGFPPKLHSRAYTTGEASAQVLIDTERSQIADLDPTGSPYVYQRASLLSNLMATASVQQQLASRLKLPPGALSVTPPATSIIAPMKATGLAIDGAALAQIKPSWNLAITIDPNLPLLDFTANAPTPTDASDLDLAAIAVLKAQIGGLVKREDVPAGEAVVVNTIGPPVPMGVAKGFRKAYGAAITLIMFIALCFMIVLVDRSRLRRQAPEVRPAPPWRVDAVAAAGAQRALFVRTFKMQQIARAPSIGADDDGELGDGQGDGRADASLAETPPL